MGTEEVGPRRDTFSLRPVLGVAGAVSALLLATAGRYGYHRDELYFLAAGRHLAWGYPDQPPLVPAVARLISHLAEGSVLGLRVPSALAAGCLVVLAAASAYELGASRPAQLLAATGMATAGLLLGVSHLLSTATFYVLVTAGLIWLVVRSVNRGSQRGWVLVGLVAGVGLLDSDLVAFVMAAIVVGLLVSGPRDAFRSPWLWVGGAIALAMWAPYLDWQARHSWPELAVSRSIAAGHSGTSQPRGLLLPEQLVLVSPFFAPVWLGGLVRLLRDPALRRHRWIPVAWIFLALLFEVTGGKSYYLAGMFPILLGAGAQPFLDWVRRRSAVGPTFGIGVPVSALLAVLVALPVVPVAALHDTPIVSVNYDSGETVGWPDYVTQIGAVYRRLPPDQRVSTVIVTSNYGEAGAVDRYGPEAGLPPAYSGHNGFWYWGPPPAGAAHAVAVGFSPGAVSRFCSDPVLSVRLHNRWSVKNDEEGAPVWSCARLRGTWPEIWPRMKRTG